MIPKIINYCWFGMTQKPDNVKRYIESWKKYCPDYQILEWNEENFDVNQNTYCSEAYEAQKWAFVSDYARLWVLYNHGGIYLDTDVEVVQPLDQFLNEKGFSGFESNNHVSTGIMASERGHNYIGDLLNTYNERKFIKENGEYDLSTNVKFITEFAVKNKLILNGQRQTILDFTYYPQSYFSPFNDNTGEVMKTKDTYTIHWFSKSWLNPKLIRRTKITRVFHRIFGVNCFNWLRKILKNE
jgi:mannosyltransferase OCH1-like enzyme